MSNNIPHEFSRYNRHSIYDYVLYRCGFGNYNSFLRAFRKFLGVSPREVK